MEYLKWWNNCRVGIMEGWNGLKFPIRYGHFFWEIFGIMDGEIGEGRGVKHLIRKLKTYDDEKKDVDSPVRFAFYGYTICAA